MLLITPRYVLVHFNQPSSIPLNMFRMIYLWHNIELVESANCHYAFETCYLSHLHLSLLRSWSSIHAHQQIQKLMARDPTMGMKIA